MCAVHWLDFLGGAHIIRMEQKKEVWSTGQKHSRRRMYVLVVVLLHSVAHRSNLSQHRKLTPRFCV